MNREIEAIGELEAPAWLDKIATEHWLHFVPILAKRRLLTEADVSLLAAASERWSVYRRAASLMKGSVRGKKFAASERMKLAEQAARRKLAEADVRFADLIGEPVERKRGKLRRGMAPEGNELDAEPVLELDPKLLGEWVVPPQHSIATQALQDYLTIMKEFGVGPASRHRMKVEDEEAEEEERDQIAEFRSRRERRAAGGQG